MTLICGMFRLAARSHVLPVFHVPQYLHRKTQGTVETRVSTSTSPARILYGASKAWQAEMTAYSKELTGLCCLM